MAAVGIAQITCPSCNQPFQTYVEQILDVHEDPSAKTRLLNGLINTVQCPHCGMHGTLNVPFLYHDSEKELALIYMPMEAGRTDMDRQQMIGKFTNAVMNDLPPEKRKAYLLQPQIHFSLESLVNTVLEADGVTPEMIEAQKARARLLQTMIEAGSEEAQEALIRENQDMIDAEFIQTLAVNIDMAQSAGEDVANLRPLISLYNKLLAQTDAGRAIKDRVDTLEALRADPSREKLLELLVSTSDPSTRELLITFGRPLLDYLFFQSLTQQIEECSDAVEKDRLTNLRSEILAVRDRIDKATQALLAERSQLLQELILSTDPEEVVRQHLQEIDDAFFTVLSANMEEARTAGDAKVMKALERVWTVVLQVIEEAYPPEIRLFARLMKAKDEAEIDRLLDENAELLTPQLVELLRGIQKQWQSDEEQESAERAAMLLNKVSARVAAVQG